MPMKPPTIRIPAEEVPRPDLDEMLKRWWYYSVELAPDRIATGIYPPDLPMLPRRLLRNCDPTGADCLDIGCMEGLAATLLAKRGARRVIATDASDHCFEKLAAVQHTYNVRFGFSRQDTVYNFQSLFARDGFDLINISGLLYHVMSPLLVLAGVRPLLKRHGLLIVCTNVIAEPGFSMEFNAYGRMQNEANTFWYPTIELFDYWLRMLKLAPIDAAFIPHAVIREPIDAGGGPVTYLFDKPSGYLGVVCRAADAPLPRHDDQWMIPVAKQSWEYNRLFDWSTAARQPKTTIGYSKGGSHSAADQPIDIWKTVQESPPLLATSDPTETHLLRLSDRH